MHEIGPNRVKRRGWTPFEARSDRGCETPHLSPECLMTTQLRSPSPGVHGACRAAGGSRLKLFLQVTLCQS